ncbi:hypothetical protein SPRG_12278 [Saprolegnia parasitica CBS 223.65]|uniref:LNR domain-containing protein n=1 Tax=Saprolegnia parasitica (strain CBS 223.65) TaxID=695850 RepID=A0A067BVW1_SAPPC|nr:hypothetical protein SPRG_12278 [Saprolegnia parasitica CBS 223.65]KDO22649.1 hypothetical protein SPRG_12278 [Saprolegnia parasitica CBS 223.65]|eukprot:XP_012206656.1 hypothetical protein SPRG_12278 [Saprolegnia parasitica CBS 223.65]
MQRNSRVLVAPAAVATGPAPPSIEYTLRRPFLIISFLKFIASGVYLALASLLMITGTPSTAIKFQVYAMQTASGPLYAAFALLHLAAAIEMLLPARCRRLHAASGTSLLRKAPTWLSQSIQCVVSAVQLVQAYKLSASAVSSAVTTAYSLTLVASCLLPPWLSYSSHPFVRHHMARFFWSFFGFLLATGVNLAFFLVPVVHVTFQDKRLGYGVAWTTEYVLLTRCLVPGTLLDLIGKLVLFGMSYLSSRQLVQSIFAVAAPAVPSRLLSAHLRTLASVKDTLSFRKPRSRCTHVFLMVHLVIGSMVLAMVLSPRPACPANCELAVAPWLRSTCQCILYHFNGHDNVSIDATTLSSERLGDRLFFLHLTNCPTLPDLQLLAPFSNLYGLTIESGHATSWSKRNASWPPSLISLNLRYIPLRGIPEALLELPPNLQTLSITGCLNISRLPTTVRTSWATVAWLILNDNAFDEMPHFLANFSSLERLVVSTNRLTTLPEAALASLPHLTRLEAAQNSLTQWPTHLIDAKPALFLDLSNNPIAAVPTTDAIASRLIVLDGSDYCNATLAAGCYAVCSPLCSNVEVGDKVCQRNCWNAACQWDGNDCANSGSQ